MIWQYIDVTLSKAEAHRGQIAYPYLHFCQNSWLVSFTNPILAPLNLHLPLLHQDPTHLTVLGKSLASWLTSLHRLSDSPVTTWTPLAVSLDYRSYSTAWRWDIFMFGVIIIIIACTKVTVSSSCKLYAKSQQHQNAIQLAGVVQNTIHATNNNSYHL